MNTNSGVKQIRFSFLLLCLFPLAGFIPRAISNISGSAGLLTFPISIAILVPQALLVGYFFKKNNSRDLYSRLCSILGVVTTKLLLLFYCAFALLNAVFGLMSYKDTAAAVMPQTPGAALLVPMALLVLFALVRGVKTVFRFCEIMLLFLVVMLAVMLGFALPVFDAGNIFAPTSSEIAALPRAMPYILGVGGNIILFPFFADYIKKDKIGTKSFVKMSLIFAGIGFVLTLFLYGTFGARLTAAFNIPLYNLTRESSFLGVIGRVDFLMIFIMFASQFAFVGMFAYVAALCFRWVFNRSDTKLLPIILMGLIFVTAIFSPGIISAANVGMVSVVFQFLIPFIVYVVYCFKKRCSRGSAD